MNVEKKNLPASRHHRLLNKARQSGRAFNELIQYYAIERLLYRLSISGYSELFTLKGALMFNACVLVTASDYPLTRTAGLFQATVNLNRYEEVMKCQ